MVVVAIAVSGLGFLAGHATAGTSHPAPVIHPKVYVVRTGDTLWSIALRLGGPGSDPRPLVDRLTTANHVPDAEITPGERLVVPAP
jgi:nucleoid-associated protein YgaU